MVVIWEREGREMMELVFWRGAGIGSWVEVVGAVGGLEVEVGWGGGS